MAAPEERVIKVRLDFEPTDPAAAVIDRIADRILDRVRADRRVTAVDRAVEQWFITAPQGVFEVLMDTAVERSRQEEKGYTPEHDDEHGLTHLVPEALNRLGGIELSGAGRHEFVEVIAMLVAAVEVIDRQAAHG